ncbi:MAG: hypothetical protein LBR35_01295 [Rickettsiales bacterium]|jgi:tRNA (guanine-N7-)-methyltransferase|nr:hypothetical protein [Rickettsiales bacterium]
MNIKHKKFYGRRKGKQLTPNQERLVADVLPSVVLKLPLQFENKFKEVHLDIGFGTGTNLNYKIQKNPDIFFIGAEPFINGTAQFLSLLPEELRAHIQIYNDDITEIWNEFEDATFDKVYLLYPDPWPKARHEKRRFVSVNNLLSVHRLLKSGGTIDIVSDIAHYIELLMENLKGLSDKFEIIYFSKTPFADWHTTKYEQKALAEGRIPQYVILRKKQ